MNISDSNSIYNELNKENSPFVLNFQKSENTEKSTIEMELERKINNVEEIPVGMKTKFILEEYPPEFNINDLQNQENEQIMPLEDRLKSKIWKTRQKALDDLADIYKKTEDPNDTVYLKYISEFIKLVSDSNPLAQEKSLSTFYLLLEKINIVLLKEFDWKELLKVLIDKSYNSNKSTIKEYISKIFIFFCKNVEKNAVFDVLISGLTNKNQKTATNTIQLLLILIRNFGVKKLDYLKLFFPELEKLTYSISVSTKNESLEFYKECYKWMGEGMLIFTIKINKSIKSIFDKFVEEYSKIEMIPLIQDSPKKQESNSLDKKENVDMYDILEGIDIFNKFNDIWCEKVLNQSKWNEKKQLLDDLLINCSVPKLLPTNFFPLISLLKRVLQDSNINVVLSAIKITGNLAKSLRKSFSQGAKILFMLLFLKFKEKKTQIIDETHKTLESFLYCLSSFDEITEDMKELLSDKCIGVKLHSLIWLEKFMDKNLKINNNKNSNNFNLKSLLLLIKSLLDDGSLEVRDQSSKLLAKFKLKMGLDYIPNFFNDISSVKMQKINEFESRYTEKSNQIKEITQSELRITPIKSIPIFKEEKSSLKYQLPNKILIKNKNIPISNQNKNNTKNINNNNAQEKNNYNIPNITINLEEAENNFSQIEEISSFSKDYDLKTWKEKIELIENIVKFLENSIKNKPILLDSYLKIMKNKFKDWKESNLNLIKAFLNSLMILSDINLNLFSKQHINIISEFSIEKFTEGKYSELIWNIYYNLFHYISPDFIIFTFLQILIENNLKDLKKINSKMLIEFINFLIKTIENVSLNNLPFKNILDFSKILLQNSTPFPALRQSIISLINKIYQYIGSDLLQLLKDLPINLFQLLQNNFQKISILSENEKIPLIKSLIVNLSNNSNSNLTENYPKTDISIEFNKLIKKISDSDWKIQKEGLDEIEKLLNINPRIQLSNLSEFFNCLKNGLKDKKNRSLLRIYINITGKISEAGGKEFINYGRNLIQYVLTSLSDKQNILRNDVINCLQKIENSCGSEFILNNLSLFLTNNDNKELQSFEAKFEIFNWMLKNIKLLIKYNNLKSLIVIFVTNLLDKTKEIRTLSEQIIEQLILVQGCNIFYEAIKDFKPAISNQLKLIIDKYNQNKIIINNTNNNKQQNKLIKEDNLDEILKKSNFMQIEPSNEERKKNRYLFEEKNSWSINEINDQLIEKLKEEINLLFPSEIAKKLFSYDYKKNIEGKFMLKKTFSEKEIINFSDLLIKWCFFKLWGNSNLDLLIEIFDLIIIIVDCFIKTNEKLYDFELVIILSILQTILLKNGNQFFSLIVQCHKNLKLIGNNMILLPFWYNIHKLVNDEILLSQINDLLNDSNTIKNTIISQSDKKRKSFCGNEIFLSKEHTILLKNIDILTKNIFPDKIDALTYIRNFVREDNSENLKIIEKEASLILSKFTEIYKCFDYNYSLEFIIFAAQICQDMIVNKYFAENLDEKTLFEFMESILNRLLHEDANKTQEISISNFSIDLENQKREHDTSIKTLNSLILKILESCSPTKVYSVLFDLLFKYRQQSVFSKFVALCIKCILKLTKVLQMLLKDLNIEQLFYKFHLFLIESIKENVKANEDLGIKTIKTILKELVKYKGSEVISIYKSASFYNEIEDDLLIKWMELMLVTGSDLKKQKRNFDPNEGLKLVIIRLKDPMRYEDGVIDLYETIIENEGINLNFFTNHFNKVEIEKIKQSLKNVTEIRAKSGIRQEIRFILDNN